MMLVKPKFWDSKIGIISIILLPFSFFFLLIIFLKRKFTNAKKFKIPVVCVGNIYVGGTGKTPTSIFLAKEISKNGKKTAILRSYHKTHKDEYSLIKSNFENLVIKKNRLDGLRDIEKSNFDIVVMDDGLQDYRIKKDLSIICFNENQMIGNGLVFPSGPLRENLNALKHSEIIIINGTKNINFENKVLSINRKLNIFYSSYEPVNIKQFKNVKLLAVAGIGNPENFFKLLENNNLAIEKKLIYPDHYNFSENEIRNIVDYAAKRNYQIVMTEKDYYKVKDYKMNEIKYLKVKLKIDNQEKLLKKINELHGKNN